MRLESIRALTVVTFLAATNAFAVSIVDGSFEEPKVAVGGYKYLPDGSSIPGWTVIIDDNAGEMPWIISEQRWNSSLGIDAHGAQALVLNAGSGIMTEISLVAGQEYEFSVWGMGRSIVAPLQVEVGGYLTSLTFGDYFEIAGGFHQRTFNFVASETTDTAILKLLNVDENDIGYRQWIIDNVQVNAIDAGRTAPTTVPDSGATSALLGLGLLGISAAQRQFRK